MREEYLAAIIPTALMTVGLIVVLGIFVQQVRTRRRHNPQLMKALLVAILGAILQLMAHVGYFFEDPRANFFQDLTANLFVISFYFLYSHYEALSNDRPPFWRQGPIFALVMLNMFYFLLSLGGIIPREHAAPLNFFLFSVTGVACFVPSVIVASHSHKLMRERTTSFELSALLVLLSGNMLYLVTVFLAVIGIMELSSLVPAFILGSGMMALGVFFYMLTYLLHVDYIYRLPFPIHYIMVYNAHGLLVYSRRVETPQLAPLYIQAEILSGAFLAITSLIRETLGTTALLKEIDATNYRVLFATLHGHKGMVAIITSRSTYFVRHSLQRFARSFSPSLLDQINEGLVTPSKLQKTIDDLMLQSFPYLRIMEHP